MPWYTEHFVFTIDPSILGFLYLILTADVLFGACQNLPVCQKMDYVTNPEVNPPISALTCQFVECPICTHTYTAYTY